MASAVAAACGVWAVLAASSPTATEAASPVAPPIYGAVTTGDEDGKGYGYAPSSFERIDTVSGNLSLVFADLSLPGNAGHGLTFLRSYNSAEGRWRLGLAQMPLHFRYASGSDLSDVSFVGADGSEQRAAGSGSITYTAGFGRFTKANLTLELPNGLKGTYAHVLSGDGGYLTEIRDPFDNVVTLSWASGTDHLQSVTQALGQGQSRTVTFTNWTDDRADGMAFNGRSWTYQWQVLSATPEAVAVITSATLPEATSWAFTYATDSAGGKKLASVISPLGGQIAYSWSEVDFGDEDRVVLSERSTSSNVAAATWTFAWQSGGTTLTVTGPSQQVVYGTTTVGSERLAGTRTVKSLGGTTLESETLTYESVANPVATSPLLKTRVLTRDGATYSTTYTYASTDYGNYGQPSTIQESGHLSRTTSLTYQHSFTPYIRGRVASTAITIGGTTLTQSYAYQASTGFLTSATDATGATTTLAPDARGNVASVTDAASHSTSLEYSWGVVSYTTSPSGRTLQQSINADSTVATVTQAGQTVSMGYDGLGRVVSVTPPVGAGASTTYNGTTVTVTRGVTTAQTQLDGFGRPLTTTIDPGYAQGAIHQRWVYDAGGRTTYASQPYTSADVGTTLVYDGLGRVTSTTGADGATSQAQYFSWGVRQTDARGRVTDQTWAAFGRPGDARLTAVTDPAGQLWVYTLRCVRQSHQGGRAAGPRLYLDLRGRPSADLDHAPRVGDDHLSPLRRGRTPAEAGRCPRRLHPLHLRCRRPCGHGGRGRQHPRRRDADL